MSITGPAGGLYAIIYERLAFKRPFILAHSLSRLHPKTPPTCDQVTAPTVYTQSVNALFPWLLADKVAPVVVTLGIIPSGAAIVVVGPGAVFAIATIGLPIIPTCIASIGTVDVTPCTLLSLIIHADPGGVVMATVAACYGG